MAFREEKDPLNVNFLAFFWHFPNPLIKLNQKMLVEQGKVRKVGKWVTLLSMFGQNTVAWQKDDFDETIEKGRSSKTFCLPCTARPFWPFSS